MGEPIAWLKHKLAKLFRNLPVLTMRLIRHVIRNQSIGESLETYSLNIAANRRNIMHGNIGAGEKS